MTHAESHVLPEAVCRQLLREGRVGRLAAVVGGKQTIVPANFRYVEMGAKSWIVFRTAEGTVLDQPGVAAAFEIDEVAMRFERGWSVLARGVIEEIAPDVVIELAAAFDPGPWLGNRERWLAIDVDEITGREIVIPNEDWLAGS